MPADRLQHPRLVDRFGRRIDYLRLSVTDLCNLRCHYCMPLEGVLHRPRAEILSFEEITRMVRILSGSGVQRVRLTGGEPLVRRGLPDLIRRLKEIRALNEVLLTTNGVLLRELARPLREAGLEEINIHLDTLSPERFRRITRWGTLQEVLDGIEAAREAGLHPIKINMVVQRGVNDDEIGPILRFAAERRLILRLIELMPIGPAREIPSAFLSLEEVQRRLAQEFSLKPCGFRFGSGPAVYWRVAELDTVVGFISPLSRPFCEGCNRIRIGSDGAFQDCLAFEGTFSIRDLLRDPALDDGAIAARIADLIRTKREGHFGFGETGAVRNRCMYGIGG